MPAVKMDAAVRGRLAVLIPGENGVLQASHGDGPFWTPI
jgi:hypothetical protein